MPQTQLSKEEIAKAAKDLYDREIRSQVETNNIGKIVVIDIQTGDYEVSETGLKAAERVQTRHPNAILYAIRIGYDVVYAFGGYKPRQTK